jgi:hypothetical protein
MRAQHIFFSPPRRQDAKKFFGWMIYKLIVLGNDCIAPAQICINKRNLCAFAPLRLNVLK